MKKIFKNRNSVLVGLFAVLNFSNCTKLTDNLSTDPVNITNSNQVTIPLLISGVETSVIGVYEGDATRIGAMWTSYFDGEDRQYSGLQTYATSGQDYDNEWVTIYDAIFKNTKIIKQKARAVDNLTALGLSQVIEAMVIGTAADLWGDVPFSQIASYPTILTPKFDAQSSVYAAAQALLDSAINNLGATGAIGEEDFFFNGDVTKWQAVAHTIKARLYLHTRDYSNALTQAALGVGSITRDASGNLMAPHGKAYGQTFNLYYSFLTYDRPGYMSATNSYAPTLLDSQNLNYRGNRKTKENGRLCYIYGGSKFGGFNITSNYDPNVLCNEDPGVLWMSTYGLPTTAQYDGFFGCANPFPIVTFQENVLIMAEANVKLGNFQPAIDALNTLRAFYRTGAQFGTSTGYITDLGPGGEGGALGGVQYDDYVAADFTGGAGIENKDNIDRTQALLREILEERYVTLIGQLEGWNDMRRTNNYLNIPLPPGKTDFPRRFLYSQIEINTNPNVPTNNVGLFSPVPAFSSPY